MVNEVGVREVGGGKGVEGLQVKGEEGSLRGSLTRAGYMAPYTKIACLGSTRSRCPRPEGGLPRPNPCAWDRAEFVAT
jgi:hypothetical protein